MNEQPTVWRILKAVGLVLLVALVFIVLAYAFAAHQVSQIYTPEQKPQLYTRYVDNQALEIAVTPGWVNPGQSATIRFTIRNTGTDTFTRERLDGPVMDLVVPTGYYDDNKARGNYPPGTASALPVVRWSETVDPAQIPHRLELKPGESRSIELTYTPRIGHGREDIEGLLWNGHTAYDKSPGAIQVGLGP